jgi:undecaprenyl-diphosphatase
MRSTRWYKRWFADEGLLGLELTIGFLIALFAGIIFKLIADEVFEAPGIRSTDLYAQQFADSIASPWLTKVMEVITFFGNWPSLVILSAAIAIILLIEHSRRRFYTFTSIMAGGALLNTLLKDTFHRARPDLIQIVQAHGFSFPSGHSMGSTLFFGGLAYVLFFSVDRHPFRRVTGVVLCLIASIAIGLSRVYLHVHYLSDVAAGFVAGLAWIGICVSSTEGWIRWKDRRRSRKNTV